MRFYFLNPATKGFVITGSTIGDRLGWSASAARYINNDGYGDIIVGVTLRWTKTNTLNIKYKYLDNSNIKKI